MRVNGRFQKHWFIVSYALAYKYLLAVIIVDAAYYDELVWRAFVALMKIFMYLRCRSKLQKHNESWFAQHFSVNKCFSTPC